MWQLEGRDPSAVTTKDHEIKRIPPLAVRIGARREAYCGEPTPRNDRPACGVHRGRRRRRRNTAPGKVWRLFDLSAGLGKPKSRQAAERRRSTRPGIHASTSTSKHTGGASGKVKRKRLSAAP
ncbi:hypothetical protein EYF80_059203 [Liparis tanakae]|uniref:Uncharacterized protein n=1 Tax=Liparis tanakae TaxID=230148 RepID=A0A4Z2EPD6_9TELE|nr:hypothetical protein EYF80_059203 [Liparis tanakae]